MVTLFSCIGVHAFRYCPYLLSVNRCRARRSAMKARIVQGTANRYSVCDTAMDTIVRLAFPSRSIAKRRVTKYFGLSPKKKFVPFFVDSHVVCLVGTSLMQHENYRARPFLSGRVEL